MNRERAHLCLLGSLQAVKLSHWALLRDSTYYTFSVTALIVVRGHGLRHTRARALTYWHLEGVV